METPFNRRTFCKSIAAAGAGLAAGGLLPRAVRAADRDDWGSPFPDPVFPFGAVYFRKSSPPADEWARDHRVAASMGINIFRHWFLWASIENEPDQYDWSDYDRMVQLEGQDRIKTVIAESIYGAPGWMWHRYPHARRVLRDGSTAEPGEATSSATGWCPLCLDNDDVRERAGRFLSAMAERYRDRPSVLGYDVWNEGDIFECYCEATKAKFRQWLKAKYGTMEALGRAWHFYSWGDWDNIEPPYDNIGYPISLDWLAFQRDNAIELFKWRIATIRQKDRRNRIVAHGVAKFRDIEWRMADEVSTFGLTWVASRHGNAPWMQFQAVDLTRGASQGKPFWHAEATGGPLWLQPQVVNRPLSDGRSSDAKDVRVWSLIDMACGATGIQFTRWRPLMDDPLFGAFGPMGMDGSVTPRAGMAGQLARWTNAHPDIWRSRPVRGDVALIFLQEAADFSEIQGLGGGGGRGAAAAGADGYIQSSQGAYQGFFDNNIQADFVDLDQLKDYPLAYLPYPEHLTQATADRLREYVEGGGCLVSEGCPGYFGENARVGEVQPNLGLDRLFGARETYVQFTPDILTKLTLTVRGETVAGQYFLQEYELAGGRAAGTYANGHLAAVENTAGSGRTLLIGTFPGGGYFRTHSASTRKFFAGLLEWAGVRQRVRTDDPEIRARLHQGPGGTYLWVVNPTRQTRTAKLTLPSAYREASDLWQDSGKPSVAGNVVTATVEDRNAAVIRLS